MAKPRSASPPRPARRPKAEVQSIRALVVLCLAVIMTIVFVPSVRAVPFAQGIAGLTMALLVAVVIFALFPAPPGIKVPVSLVTASGFYLALLPRIERYIFPVTNLNGLVRYEGTSIPVEHASITADGRPTTTDAAGAFSISRIPSDVDSIEIRFRQFDTTVAVNARGVYAVVANYETRTSAPRAIPGRWVDGRAELCGARSPGSPRARAFAIAESLSTNPEEWRSRRVADRSIHLRLRPSGQASIVSATISEPEGAARDLRGGDEVWHWKAKATHDVVVARITACVTGAANAAPAPLELSYWLEGIERARKEASP